MKTYQFKVFSRAAQLLVFAFRSKQRANSSQQPTRGRSLARRFHASLRAALRVAPREREGRDRLSERTLGRLTGPA